ncbi:MAG: imidazole glycerol phosphate synthase subunit HisF [Candidatus Yanofskybacteria bacterium RIFCSPHIGHO2_02_FULL_41_11]|uniref:imidazole glycerol-phosphate synthase n=1 Tax=Candidatus Yanofskybacteria bacterium RIFCSPHIGHO2_02_FULL_41_11 TaxID=1802675 RepID=A0A1F8FBW8_9BACT|nr:MAG: imidazole glycerol phosphate synthase subunit HisF [Candidatus Yanofskybacteria bacterium RIFCSPHIGHO2_02_FULL_41_11]
MENIRIIPRLDIKGLNVVKGMHTEGLRVVGNPRDFALRYYQEGADELLYMDIVASLYQRNLDFDLLKSVADGVFIPITVGGGIRSVGDINNVLRAGADKVAINTYAISHPEFLREAADKFGSQCIVLSVEAKKVGEGKWEAYTDGGREKTGVGVVEWIKKAIDFGIGEIIITSIDHEGTRRGYDLDLVKAITSFAVVPVIAHGGAGSMESVRDVILNGQTDAISAASIFHYKDYPIERLKKFLNKEKINVRLQ